MTSDVKKLKNHIENHKCPLERPGYLLLHLFGEFSFTRAIHVVTS